MENKIDALLTLLRKRLHDGDYPQGSRFPSLSELAEEFGVNKMTANKVSIALLSEGYLKRSGSYRAGFSVKSNFPFPSGKIALIGGVYHPYFAQIADGIFQEAFQKNYLVTPITPQPQHLEASLKTLVESGFQGILTYSYFFPKFTALPVVYLEHNMSGDETGVTVSCDNFSGGKQMVEQLVRTGRREILFCLDGIPAVQFNRRNEGMIAAARAAGIGNIRERIFNCTDTASRHDSAVTLQEMLKKFPKTNAIVTDSDDRVVLLLAAARLLGISVPRQLVITGFGNIAAIQNIFPFPTVDEHPFEIGVRGVDLLIKMIENGVQSVPREVEIPVNLVNQDKMFPDSEPFF